MSKRTEKYTQYEDFKFILETKMLNKSKIIESLIKKWIKENKLNDEKNRRSV